MSDRAHIDDGEEEIIPPVIDPDQEGTELDPIEPVPQPERPNTGIITDGGYGYRLGKGLTVRACIERVDAMKPNTAREEEKARWLFELESILEAEFYPQYEKAEDGEEEKKKEQTWDMVLSASGAYDSLYDYWLMSNIDLLHQEPENFNNDMELFRARMGDYRKWYHRTHKPKSAGTLKLKL